MSKIIKAHQITKGMKFIDAVEGPIIAVDATHYGAEDSIDVEFRYPGRKESSGSVYFAFDDDVMVWTS